MSNEGEETIAVSGAFALYPMVVQWSEEFKKKNPHIRFNISAGGAGKGIADVLSGMVDIGLVSRDIHPEEYQRGAFLVNVAGDAVVASFNANNPAVAEIKQRGLTRQEFVDIFLTNKISKWSDLSGIRANYDMHVYVRSDAAGAAETWANFLGGVQEDLLGIGVFGDPGQAQAIIRDPLSIGFSNINFVYSLENRRPVPGVELIPIDLDQSGAVEPSEDFYGNLDSLNAAIIDGRYPSPPARKLGFLLYGKPNSTLINEFLAYVLSEEGQELLPANGYIRLSAEDVEEELIKLAE